MKAEKLTWVMFTGLVSITFGVVAFAAPQVSNQILAGIMSGVFGLVLILTIRG